MTQASALSKTVMSRIGADSVYKPLEDVILAVNVPEYSCEFECEGHQQVYRKTCEFRLQLRSRRVGRGAYLTLEHRSTKRPPVSRWIVAIPFSSGTGQCHLCHETCLEFLGEVRIRNLQIPCFG